MLTDFDYKLETAVDRLNTGTVLIIDDNSEVHRLLRAIFLKIGIRNIKSTSDILDAINFLDILSLSMVVCDYHLGVHTAVDVHRELRMKARYSNIPFLVITNDLTLEELLFAKQNGITSCILKPFSLDIIQEKLVDLSFNSQRS